MFDLSFGKLAIIFTLCLIVLGPEKLPKLAAQLGRWTGQARAMARHFREQLEQEIATEELMKQKREFEQVVADSVKSTTDPMHDATQTVENVIHPSAPSQIAASQVESSQVESSHAESSLAESSHVQSSQGELWEDSHLSSGYVDLGQPISPLSDSSGSAVTESATFHGSAESLPKSTNA